MGVVGSAETWGNVGLFVTLFLWCVALYYMLSSSRYSMRQQLVGVGLSMLAVVALIVILIHLS